MTPGISGLAFLPSKLFDPLKLVACSDCLTVGAGAVLCTFIFVWYDNYLAEHKSARRHGPHRKNIAVSPSPASEAHCMSSPCSGSLGPPTRTSTGSCR